MRNQNDAALRRRWTAGRTELDAPRSRRSTGAPHLLLVPQGSGHVANAPRAEPPRGIPQCRAGRPAVATWSARQRPELVRRQG